METGSTASSVSSVDGRSSSGGLGSGSTADYLTLGMFSSGGVGGGVSTLGLSQPVQLLQQQQHKLGDLLVGSGGNSGNFMSSSLGNGFSSDGGIGTSSGTSFDLNDFPSLGGTSSSSQPSSNTIGSNNSGLAAALRQQQQQMLAHQQQMMQQSGLGSAVAVGANSSQASKNLYRLAMTGSNGNFSMTSEDFPALSAGTPGQTSLNSVGGTTTGNIGGGVGGKNGSSSLQPLSGGSLMGASRMYSGSDLDGGLSSQLEPSNTGSGLLGSAGLGGLRGMQSQPNAVSALTSALPGRSQLSSTASSGPGAIGNSTSATGSSAAAGTALAGDYGLLGLLSVIRLADSDRNFLALGSDLTLLGLNLGTTEQIYGTFASPWSDSSKPAKEPHFQVRFTTSK
jgi:CCR4-NOT transcription complex subunit 2